MNKQNTSTYDALIVGSGPNGLSAAIRLALEGLSVKICESSDTIGGGTRTRELTLPGLKHDVCSAIHPMAVSSPFLRNLPLNDYGLEWIHPDYPVAHPLDDQPAVFCYRDLDETANSLGEDSEIYKNLFRPLVQNWDSLTRDILGPLRFPSHPLNMASFGIKALKSAEQLAAMFKSYKTAALFGGLAGHSILSFDKPATSAIGLVLGAAAHAVGWPLPKGGSQSISKAMAAYLESLGGKIDVDNYVSNIDQLPKAKAILFDLTPAQVLKIAGHKLPPKYINKLKHFRYGSGVFKMDFALSGKVPWKDERCKLAGTVHLGGTFDEMAQSEKEISNGKHPQKPYVLVAQQSYFDRTRTPDHKETLWAYCHVPNSSTIDMTTAVEDQIERFAPGFKDIILKKHTMDTAQMQSYNPNYIGGDINGGAQDIKQLFTRPVSLFDPYSTPTDNIFFCSASTPPGGGVHGMCGYHAAETVLKKVFKFSKHNKKFTL